MEKVRLGEWTVKVPVMNLNESGKRNLFELQRDPGAALDAFSAPKRWEMDIHKDIIARRKRDFSLPSEAAADETFLKDLHHILKAWFGKHAWLIIDYGEDFRLEVREAAALLDALCGLRIETLQDGCGCPGTLGFKRKPSEKKVFAMLT